MMAGASLIKSGLAQRGGIFSAWAKATMRRCLIPSLTVHDGAWRLPQSRCLASYAVPPNRRSGNQLKREAREKSKSNDASAVDGEGAVDTPANDSEGGGEAERIGRSRGRHDRADSLSAEILSDRAAHLERIRLAIAESDSVGGGDEVKAAIARLESLGFGHKKLKNQIYGEFSKSGAGGHALHVGSARSCFPLFRHLLPEIVLAGHTNSGKSTLVNALAGIHPTKGPASVSDRAGWTDLICFYQIGKRPPVLTLVDVPGYGHAVADAAARAEWTRMTRECLRSRRLVVARCCVLVDSSRGIGREDREFIRSAYKLQIPVQVVLTKADLLSAAQLAHAMAMTRADMGAILSDLESEARRILSSASAPRGGDAAESPPRPVWRQGVVLPPEALVVPVSAATGAGIQPLWLSVCDAARRCALTTSPSGAPLPPNAVREHAAANAMRRQKQLELVQ